METSILETNYVFVAPVPSHAFLGRCYQDDHRGCGNYQRMGPADLPTMMRKLNEYPYLHTHQRRTQQLQKQKDMSTATETVRSIRVSPT